jgi:DNA-binding Xre family transcriptional regulator
LSQNTLSKLAKLDRNHISRLKTGTANIALDTIEKVVDALKVDISKILG